MLAVQEEDRLSAVAASAMIRGQQYSIAGALLAPPSPSHYVAALR